MSHTITIEQGIRAAGVGKFQYRLFVIFGSVWLADAMQVLSIGFTAPSIASTFGIPVPTALQTGTMFFVGMLVGAFVFGRLADRIGRRPVLMMAVVIDAACGVASAFAPDFQSLLLLRLLTASASAAPAGRLHHDGRVSPRRPPRPLAGPAGVVLGGRHHPARRAGPDRHHAWRQRLGG